MANNQINLEAFNELHNAIKDYQEKLDTNKRILLEAANVCDQAMGSDPIVKKKIAKLENALAKLDAACERVEEAAAEVVRRRARADEIVVEA